MNENENLESGKKKKKTCLIIGIILLVFIGIPLLLFGACMLFIMVGRF